MVQWAYYELGAAGEKQVTGSNIGKFIVLIGAVQRINSDLKVKGTFLLMTRKTNCTVKRWHRCRHSELCQRRSLTECELTWKLAISCQFSSESNQRSDVATWSDMRKPEYKSAGAGFKELHERKCLPRIHKNPVRIVGPTVPTLVHCFAKCHKYSEHSAYTEISGSHCALKWGQQWCRGVCSPHTQSCYFQFDPWPVTQWAERSFLIHN